MSQENSETLRRYFDAYNRGDLKAVREHYHPEAVMHHLPDWPEPGPTVGRDAVVRFVEQLRDTWNADHLELISVTEAGDRVVFRFAWHGTGQGPESRIEMSCVTTYREGLSHTIEFFWDHGAALQTVGLSE